MEKEALYQIVKFHVPWEGILNQGLGQNSHNVKLIYIIGVVRLNIMLNSLLILYISCIFIKDMRTYLKLSMKISDIMNPFGMS